MKFLRIIMAGVISIYLLAACATQPQQDEMPGWVNGQASGYPSSQYLIGRGAGTRLTDAESRARAALALILEAQIDTEIRDQKRFERSLNPSGDVEEQSETEITRNITTRTEQVIRGARIAEIWQDPDTEEYHALASLKRTLAAQMLRGEIHNLDQMTALKIEQSRTSEDRLTAIAAASRAVDAQTERISLQKVLQVIDQTGRGIPAQWQLARLQVDRDELIGRLTIQARVQNSDIADLESRLAAALAHAGFNVSRNEKSDYVLFARLELDDLGNQDGWYWLKGSLILTLKNASGKERGARRWDIKRSGRDTRLAQRRAMDQVTRILDQELRATLIGFAGNLSKD